MKSTGTEYMSTERTPTVLPEFSELLPPLTDEQLSLLEADILKNGCYSPIIVNEDIVVVDGHNRMKICEKHGLPYRMVVFSFEDDLKAKQWALDTQKSRRNLTVNELCKIALKLRPEIEARAEARLHLASGGDRKSEDFQNQGLATLPKVDLDKSNAVNSRKELAEAVGVGERTMGKAMKIEDEAPQPVKDAVDSGEITINQGYKLTNELSELPEEEREEVAKEAVEKEKYRREMAKKNAKTDDETKTAKAYSLAFEKVQALDVSESAVRAWVTHANIYGELLDGVIEDAEEAAASFSKIAELLRSIKDMDWRKTDEE